MRIHEAIGQQLRHPSGLAGTAAAFAMAFANRRPNQAAIEALKLAPDDTVLELGFGPGRAMAALTSTVRQGRVFGIDHSAAMFRKASRHNRKAIREGLAELRLERFDALPWPAGSIDKILAVNVAYFFGQDRAEIREARRVLRPGGTMVIYVTAKAAMARFKFSSTHRLFDQNDLADLLVRGGFAADAITIRPITVAFRIPGLLAVAKKQTAAA
jgi:ubiquinone/menaquinone biosynthesis C-methylase UbiE